MNPQTALINRKTAVIGLILTVALLGFELFNFDTTRFALAQLMGGRRFLGLEWPPRRRGWPWLLAASILPAWCGYLRQKRN